MKRLQRWLVLGVCGLGLCVAPCPASAQAPGEYPGGLGAVHQHLRLAGHVEEVYGGGEGQAVVVPERVVDFLHVVLDHAQPGGVAAAALPAPLDAEFGEDEFGDIGACAAGALEDRVEEGLAVAPPAGAGGDAQKTMRAAAGCAHVRVLPTGVRLG